MKKITLACLMLAAASVLAQQAPVNTIAEAEMKSAYHLVAFTANENTANYDIQSHILEFDVDPNDYYISGVVTTNFIAKEPMGSITFDCSQQLSINSVMVNGNVASFTQNSDDELVITLSPGIAEGATATVVVDYEGEPSFNNDAFTTSFHNGSPELWTLSEPYGAKDWWPCKQDLNDKVDNIDVFITAPSQYISVSNGLQLSATSNGNGTKTTHFQHNYPIPAYLIAIAVTNYQVYNQTAGTAPNTFPIVNYLYPESVAEVTPFLQVTPPIMDLYEDLFGTYPFHAEKYGHAQCSIGGGMEHTTVSFMGGFSRELIAHELGHQWFGDKITCGSWKDIWLNEGFATYLSGLVVEHMDTFFTSWKNDRINYITSQPGGSVYLTDADTTNVGRIFSSRLSYDKGAMVVHMLRYKMGDANFYQGMQNYLDDPDLAYGYAKTPDLQEHLEAASGMDLQEFFLDWVYRQGYPSYTVDIEQLGNFQVKVTINQTQSHPSVSFFEMPVILRFTGNGGLEQEVTLEHTTNGQEFVVPVNFFVTGVQFNPYNDIVCKNNTVTLDAHDVSSLQQITIYPNPAKDILSVVIPENAELQQVVIHNTLGQKVLEGSGADISVVSLAAGVHFVTLVTDKGTRQMRFVKE